MKKRIEILIILSSFILMQFGCSGVKETIENVQRLQFKLGSVDRFNLAGVKLNNVGSIRDINILDGALLIAAFAQGKVPATFTVNLIAKNPTSPGGSKNSSTLLKALDWRLLIDNKELLTGAITTPIEVPGVGQQTIIPIPISLDLFQFFGNGGYESLINLALAIGGKTGNSSRLTLKVKPTINTFLGDFTYPSEINVVDKEFR